MCNPEQTGSQPQREGRATPGTHREGRTRIIASSDTAQIVFYVVMAVARLATILVAGMAAEWMTHSWRTRPARPETRRVPAGRLAFHH